MGHGQKEREAREVFSDGPYLERPMSSESLCDCSTCVAPEGFLTS